MGNKRNRRSRRGQSPSLERELSTSEVETSQGNETVIETLSNFENVSSVRDEEIALDSGTQNLNEMQIWTQGISDKTNKEVANLRKEMDEKLEKILKEMKNNRRTQSVQNRRYQEQTPPEQEPQNTQVMRTVKKTHLSQKTKKVKYRIILLGHLI